MSRSGGRLVSYVGAACWLSTALGGCAPPAADEAAVGSTRGAIINGTAVADPTVGGEVVLHDTAGTAGSGILSRNDWVLTAAHVVDDQVNSPANVSVELGPNNTRHAAEIHLHPLWQAGVRERLNMVIPDIIDVALVR